MECLYSTTAGQAGQSVAVEPRAGGGRAVAIEVPAAGFVMFQ
ncbi:MAG TPA: hypothetical protein VF502_00490 [Stellaceae bacterium]